VASQSLCARLQLRPYSKRYPNLLGTIPPQDEGILACSGEDDTGKRKNLTDNLTLSRLDTNRLNLADAPSMLPAIFVYQLDFNPVALVAILELKAETEGKHKGEMNGRKCRGPDPVKDSHDVKLAVREIAVVSNDGHFNDHSEPQARVSWSTSRTLPVSPLPIARSE